MEFGLYSANQNGSLIISSFAGLNQKCKGDINELADMTNLSAKDYPCMSPCKSSLKVADTDSDINAVVSPDLTNTSEVTGVTGVYNNGFYYNGVLKSDGYALDRDRDWQIVQKGNIYIINGYDGVNKRSVMYYYNIDTDEFAEGGKVMRNLILTCGANYFMTPSTDDYGIYDYSFTKHDGTVVNNSTFFERYSEYTQYDNRSCRTMSGSKNIFEVYFSVGDELTIENFAGLDNNGQIWSQLSGTVIPQPNITAARNNTVDTDNMLSTEQLASDIICRMVVTGFSIVSAGNGRYAHRMNVKAYNKNGEEISMRDLSGNYMYCSDVTIKKRARVFNTIAFHQGRIWGGIPSGNQLYASSSDDIFSFSAEDITNRYGVRLPSDTPGGFTALCSYNNDLIAFKADSMTIVSGTNPMNYGTTVIGGIGCISGKSATVTPIGIIFLGYGGFYIYNGAMPQCISEKLSGKYTEAVGGYDGESYYVSAETAGGTCELLVYNTRRDVWHKRESFGATGFFRYRDGFYGADLRSLYKLDIGEGGTWSGELMRIDGDALANKGINEIRVRADISDGSHFWVETAVGDGEFTVHKQFSESGLHVFRCPVRLKMGDSYRIKLCGTGTVTVYEIEVVYAKDGIRHKEYS